MTPDPDSDASGAHHPASDAAAVVLFDLDGVLTRKDTFATLVVRRLKASPWRLALALPALPALAVTGATPRWRGPISRYLVRVALLGLTPARARKLGVDLATEFASTPEWLQLAGIAAARNHLAAGDRVLVVTATERTLARTLLDALDLERAELLASHLTPAPGGPGMLPHNFGPQKLKSLRAARVPQPWTALYTDSWADLPAMREVQHVVLVDVSPRLERRARRALHVQVEVIRPANQQRASQRWSVRWKGAWRVTADGGMGHHDSLPRTSATRDAGGTKNRTSTARPRSRTGSPADGPSRAAGRHPERVRRAMRSFSRDRRRSPTR